MSAGKHHLFATIGLLLSTALAGAGTTFLVARSLLLSATTTRLQTYAANILTLDDELAANIDATFAAADASPYPPCSEADLALQRSLLFRSPFLKDVGRERNGTFLCSAIAGTILNPTPNTRPADIPFDGYSVYFNEPLRIDPNFHGEVIVSSKSDVVLDPETFNEFHRPPLFFSVAHVDRAHGAILTTFSNAPTPPAPELMLAGREIRRKDALFYSQCSTRRPDCVLTGIPLPSIWNPNHTILIGASILGALIGLAFSTTAVVMDLRRRTLPSQLRRALRTKDLNVLYQPIVDLKTNAIVGAEALLRWVDEDGDPVRPDLFITLAEEHGFVGEITTFVLQRVLEDMGDLLRTNPGFRVSINMSAHDLTDPTFIPRLDSMLRVSRIPAASIGLELTERSTADREHVIQTIRQLRARGHAVYIDDFGTGFSSLAYLSELDVDIIKVDRAFTRTIGTNSITASILPQILAMAGALDLHIIVEGVERAEQAAYLLAFDVGIEAQGWLFGEPLPIHALKVKLAENM